MFKFAIVYVITVLIGGEGVLFYSVAGLHSPIAGALMAPIVFVALCFGLDLCRELSRLAIKKLNHPMVAGHLILIICLVFLGVPLMLVLDSINLLCPGHLGILTSPFLVWRAASGMAILHGFIRFCDAPVSLRSIKAFVLSNLAY